MLKLLNENKLIWNQSYHHPEIIAGMIAASISILPYNYNLSTDADIKQYRVKTGITLNYLEELTKESIEEEIGKGWKAVWVKSFYSGYFDLYKFKTPHFIQGLITFCDSSKVDFRDTMRMPIFDSDQIHYTLNGYQIYNNRIIVYSPSSNDEEIEQQDNENILEPYRKDY